MMVRSTWSYVRAWPSRLAFRLRPRRIVQARGLRFAVQCDNPILHYRWQSYTTKEPETLEWIDRWVRDGDTLFDIGANIGCYTLYAALRHPRARVVALEPEYANLHVLRDNVIANGLQDRVEVYGMALGNRTGVSHLHVQDFTPGAALHTEANGRLTVTRTHKPVIWREGIATFTLDDFCEATGLRPQALKMDVDGTESEILQGAVRTLRSPALRSLLVEMYGGPAVREACGRLLAEAGLHREWSDPGKSDNEIWVRA